MDKIDSGIFDKYYNIIMECFDYSTKYDMEPKIEIGKVSRIFCYEREACVYEYLTSDSDEIVFCLIVIVFNCLISEKEKELFDDNISMSSGYRKKELDYLYSELKDVYNNYHKNGRSWMEMSVEKHWRE